jgi:putative tryptophan/tyrosine transport system substrate-binding protein
MDYYFKSFNILKIITLLINLGGSTQAANEQMLQEIKMGTTTLRINLQHIDVLPGAKDFKDAFREASNGRAEGVLMLVGEPVYNSHRAEIVELAVKNRLPAMYRNREDVEAGGLVSYGVSVTDLDRRAATYVDKVLKGVKPSEIPVEQPTKFELVVNLKAAKQIGLAIPPSVLARADKVIK